MSAPARGGMILMLAFLSTAAMNYGLGLLLAWLLAPAVFGRGDRSGDHRMRSSRWTRGSRGPDHRPSPLVRKSGRSRRRPAKYARGGIWSWPLALRSRSCSSIGQASLASPWGPARRAADRAHASILRRQLDRAGGAARHDKVRNVGPGEVHRGPLEVAFIAGLIIIARGTLVIVVLGTFAGAVTTAALTAWNTRGLRPSARRKGVGTTSSAPSRCSSAPWGSRCC